MHISWKRVACERGRVGSGRVCRMGALSSFFGTPPAAERAGSEKGEERAVVVLSVLVARLAGSPHLRTLRPSLVAVVVAFVPAI